MIRFGRWRKKRSEPGQEPPKKRSRRSWWSLFAIALVLLAVVWWQDQRNQVTIENGSMSYFSGTVLLPDGRQEAIELAPGKSAEWNFEAVKEAYIEVKGKMGEALVRVKGAKVTVGQTRVRARFRLGPDGNMQIADK